MAIRIEPYSSAYASGIARLNARLDAGNVEAGMRLPVNGPDERASFASEPCGPLVRRHYLIVDQEEVRGSFMLQDQLFEIAGQRRWVTNIQTPISEGVVDRRYALIAAKMMSMIVARNPLVFAVGMGGTLDQPFARLMSALGWPISLVPFAFNVLNPGRFLKHIRLARNGSPSSFIKNLAAWSGIGWLGLQGLGAASDLRYRLGASRRWRVAPERVTSWDDWSDEVWNAYRGGCSLAAIRDQQTLPLFHPLSSRGFDAYRFHNAAGQVVGWAALQAKAMERNRYFGSMRVATLLDAVGSPGWEVSVLWTVTRLAANANADVLISNQHHRVWRQSQRRTGFLEGPSNFLLALSPQLVSALCRPAPNYDRVHITRADGDGRVRL